MLYDIHMGWVRFGIFLETQLMVHRTFTLLSPMDGISNIFCTFPSPIKPTARPFLLYMFQSSTYETFTHIIDRAGQPPPPLPLVDSLVERQCFKRHREEVYIVCLLQGLYTLAK